MKHTGPVLIAVALKLNKMLDLSKKPARKRQQSSCVWQEAAGRCAAGIPVAQDRRCRWVLRAAGSLGGSQGCVCLPASIRVGSHGMWAPLVVLLLQVFVCPFLFPCCEFRGRAVGVSASSSLAVLKELLCSLCCVPGASGTAVGRSLSSPFPLGSGNTFPPAEDVFKVGTTQLCKWGSTGLEQPRSFHINKRDA